MKFFIFLQIFTISTIFCQTASIFQHGVDVSTAVNKSAFECLKRQGKSYVIVRVWRSIGTVDPNAVQTMRNAWDAGMEEVDGYIFPNQIFDPKDQIRRLLRHLDDENHSRYGRLWLDIEEADKYWNAFGRQRNIQFIQDMIDELEAHNKSVGIYTQKSQWMPITGNIPHFHHYPLWYAHYDNDASFEDFRPFGGWNRPMMKQYRGDVKMCGVDVDENWKP